MRTSVLVVEDEPEFMRRFSDAVLADADLSLAGVVGTGRAAIAMLDAQTPDAMLVDLGLPDIGGIEVIRHAAKHHPSCDIMVVTMFGDDEHVMGSIEAGATGYLLKDASAARIAAALHELRAGGSPISPSIARRVLGHFRLGVAAPAAPTGPAAAAAPASSLLTERETEILRLTAKGLNFDTIGSCSRSRRTRWSRTSRRSIASSPCIRAARRSTRPARWGCCSALPVRSAGHADGSRALHHHQLRLQACAGLAEDVLQIGRARCCGECRSPLWPRAAFVRWPAPLPGGSPWVSGRTDRAATSGSKLVGTAHPASAMRATGGRMRRAATSRRARTPCSPPAPDRPRHLHRAEDADRDTGRSRPGMHGHVVSGGQPGIGPPMTA